MRLTDNERRVIKDVFESSNGLFLFSLHNQTRLSPKELFLAVESLKKKELIEVKEDRVNITKKGVDLASRIQLKKEMTKDIASLVSGNFLGEKIKINEFYLPQKFEK